MKSKRPKLYFQEGIYEDQARIRIIYPDGSCEYMQNGQNSEYSCGPCWAETFKSSENDWNEWNTYILGICKSQKHAIKLMNAYDKKMEFPKAIYLGEL